MAAEARVTPIWKKQKLFVALFLIAIGGWFFWDGAVNWPRSNERWLAYDKFEKEGRFSEWASYAEAHGWADQQPHKFYKPNDILGQYAFGSLAAILGLIALAYWATQKGRVVRLEDGAIHTPAGTRVPLESITGLGKKQWESKGIARVRYEIGRRKCEFVLDDYKFDRDPTHAILAEIEATLLRRGSASQPTAEVAS